jgi:hypothetical protein
VDSATKEEEFFGESGLTRIGVCNNGECSPASNFVL